MAERAFDLVVLGSGVAAMQVATTCREAGWTVAMADRRPFGGTCVLRGCDPKKVLLGATEALAGVRRLQGKGLAGLPRVDWPALMAFKRSFTEPVPPAREQRLAELGIAALHGEARFTGPTRLAIGAESVTARHIVIATGAEPLPLGLAGAEHLALSDDFLEMETLPQRIALVGGGYIAAEFSQIAARAGAEVTVFQRGERLLPGFDADLVGWLMPSFAELGIAVHTDAEVHAIAREGDAFRVQARIGGRDIAVAVDRVFHAAGRVPALAALELGAGGIATEHGKLVLNDHLQSVSNPAVYAAGDAASRRLPLTPVAWRDGEIVAANLLQGNTRRAEDTLVPSTVFTVPALATVGLSEAAARAQGAVRIKAQQAGGWFTARRLNETIYGFKVIVGADGRIIGAHLLGPHAEEVINLFALAMRAGMTTAELGAAILAYPTAASDVTSMLP